MYFFSHWDRKKALIQGEEWLLTWLVAECKMSLTALIELCAKALKALQRNKKSYDHRIILVGGDLRRLSSSTSCSKQSQLWDQTQGFKLHCWFKTNALVLQEMSYDPFLPLEKQVWRSCNLSQTGIRGTGTGCCQCWLWQGAGFPRCWSFFAGCFAGSGGGAPGPEWKAVPLESPVWRSCKTG